MSTTHNEDLERVRRALLLPDTHPDQRRIAEIGIAFVATLLRKNADYGSSAWSTPLLAPEMDVGAAIRVRMSDKIRRIEKLLGNGMGSGTGSSPQVADESIEDTMRDLGAYALLWLARPQGNQPMPAGSGIEAPVFIPSADTETMSDPQGGARTDAPSRERQSNLERIGYCPLCDRNHELCLCEFGDFTGAELESGRK